MEVISHCFAMQKEEAKLSIIGKNTTVFLINGEQYQKKWTMACWSFHSSLIKMKECISV